MRIYLDDIRLPKGKNWVIARSFSDFKRLCLEAESIDLISFDHDLGMENGEELPSGMDCVKWLCQAHFDNLVDISETRFNVHSANPVGAKNIESYLNSFQRFLIIGPK